jgi:hypothetical protein
MIAWAYGLGMGVGRLSRPRRGVGVITMPHAELDTTRRVEVRVLLCYNCLYPAWRLEYLLTVAV